jgi:hypothetical protein
MALRVAIHDACFSVGKNLTDERALIPFAVREKYLFGNATIEVKTDMDLGLLGAVPVVGPMHGQYSINQGAVDNYAKQLVM